MITQTASSEVIAGGTTGLIKLRANASLVEKAPYPDSRDFRLSIRDLRREYIVYERLPRHSRLLHLHSDNTPERLVLPYLHNGCPHDFLRAQFISPCRKLQFAADAAEALHLLHCAGIVYSEINSWNFLLHDQNCLCIIDFSGSTIDGKAESAFEGVRYCLPRSIDDPSTARSDLFALDSLLYEIMVGEEPYRQFSDEQAVEYFEQGDFSDTEDFPVGMIILRCWQGAYDSAQPVHEDILVALVAAEAVNGE